MEGVDEREHPTEGSFRIPDAGKLLEPTSLGKQRIKSQGNVTNALSTSHVISPLEHNVLENKNWVSLTSLYLALGNRCSANVKCSPLPLIPSLLSSLFLLLPLSLFSLGPVRIPCESCMHPSNPSSNPTSSLCENHSLPQSIPPPMAWCVNVSWTIFFS